MTRAFHLFCREDGATMVEFALTVMVTLTILFGVMATCMGLYTFNVVSEAAREGSRYAIVRGSSSCGDATPDCNATAASIQTYVQSLGFPGIDPANMQVFTVWSPTFAGQTCTPSATCNNPGNQVQVTVKYTFPFTVPFIPSQTLTLWNTSQMVISQ